MDLKKIVLYSVLIPIAVPIGVYQFIKEELLQSLVRRTVKRLDFEYALKLQNNFLDNLVLDKYSELRLKKEHNDTLTILRNKELKDKLVTCSYYNLVLKSSTSYKLPTGEDYHVEIRTLWGREMGAPIKISLLSTIDSKLESGVTFAFLPLPVNQDVIENVIGVGATYHLHLKESCMKDKSD